MRDYATLLEDITERAYSDFMQQWERDIYIFWRKKVPAILLGYFICLNFIFLLVLKPSVWEVTLLFLFLAIPHLEGIYPRKPDYQDVKIYAEAHLQKKLFGA